MKSSHLTQTLALGAALITLSIGGAFAATTADVSASVMAGPGSNFKTVASIKAGDDVNVARHSGSWCKISSPAAGWVPCGDLDSKVKTTAAVVPASTGWNGYEYGNDVHLGTGAVGSLHEGYNSDNMNPTE
jgi:uncharacterized protein YraI